MQYTREYFDYLSGLYFRKNSFFWQRFGIIEKYLKPEKYDIVLECGCGTGATAIELARISRKVVAVDNYPLAVEMAKEFSQKVASDLKNLEILSASLEKLPFKDNYFDKICFSEVIEHLDKPQAVLKELSRVVKKDGVIFLSTWPNGGNLFWWLRYRLGLGLKFDFNPQSVRSIRKLLTNSGFRIKLLKTCNSYIPVLIPLLILVLGRGKKLDRIAAFLNRLVNKSVLADYLSGSILAVGVKTAKYKIAKV